MRYLREIWSSRELLFNLTQREIKGKYKRTVFGQLWSLANPLALMLIYTLVFAFILRVTPSPGSPTISKHSPPLPESSCASTAP